MPERRDDADDDRETPPDEGAQAEVDDEPMGPPPDADAEDAPLPGFPEDREPPDAG